MDEWPTHSVFMSEGRIQAMLPHPLASPLYDMVLDFMIKAREGSHAAAHKEPLNREAFGGQGFSAGRIMPSTQFFQRNRMNDYKF